MRRKLTNLFTLMGALLVASPLFGQTAAAGSSSGSSHAMAIGLAVVGLGIAAGLCGIGQGRAAASAAEGIARNPGAGGAIRTLFFIGMALIESLTLYTFVVALIAIFHK